MLFCHNTVLVYGKIIGSRVIASTERFVVTIRNKTLHCKFKRESTDKFSSAEVNKWQDFDPGGWMFLTAELVSIINQFVTQLLTVCSDNQESFMFLHMLEKDRIFTSGAIAIW